MGKNKLYIFLYILFFIALIPNVFAGYSLITDDTEIISGNMANQNPTTPLYIQSGATQYASIFKINTTTNSVSSANLTFYVSNRNFDSNSQWYFCTANFDETANEWTWLNYSTETGTCTWFYNRTFADFPLGGYITFNLTEAVKADDDGIFTIIINATIGSKFVEIVSSEGTNKPFINWSSFSVALGDLNVYLMNPTNNTINNTNTWDFYYTINSSGNMNASNCSLWTNLTGVWALNVTNTTYLATNATHNFTGISVTNDGEYVWNVHCSNGTSYINASSKFTFKKDVVFPTISTNIINASIFYKNNLTAQFNFSDNNLYRINITLDSTSYFYTYGINESLFIYNLSLDTSSLSATTHTLKVEAADGHTARQINNYIISKGVLGNYLNYNTRTNNIKITAVDGSIFDNFETTKMSDRYTFEYYPESSSTAFTFNVQTRNYLDIIESKSPPYIWLVSGNNWIDFYTTSYPDLLPTVERVDDNNVLVTVDVNNIYDPNPIECPTGKRCPITGTKPQTLRSAVSEIVFQSVGDLNVINYNYTFYVANFTWQQSISADIVGTGDTSQFNLTLNTTNFQVPYNAIKAILVFNDTTNYTPSEYIDGNVTKFIVNRAWNNSYGNSTGINYTYYWHFNISNSTAELIQYNTNATNLTIIQLGISGTCSSGTYQILNYTVYDETTKKNTEDVLINGSIEIDMYIKKGNIYWYYNTSNSFNTTNLTVCTSINLSTSLTPYYLYSAVKYSAYNHATEYNYIENYPINSSQIIKLYTLNTDITLAEYSTSFLMNYLNKYYLPEVGGIIDLLRYYVSEGEFISVEHGKMDEDGDAVLHFVAEDIRYKIIIRKDDDIIFTSNEFAALCQTTPCEINLVESSDVTDLSPYLEVDNLQYSMTLDRATRKITSTYATLDGSTSDFSLEAIKIDNRNNVSVCSSTATSSGGTLTCTVPITASNMSYRTYFKKDNQVIYNAILDLNPDSVERLGYTSIILTIFLFLTLIMMAIPSGGNAVIIFGLIGLALAALLNVFTMGGLIGIGSAFIWLVIAGLIILYKSNKRNQ